ncbi:DUF2867 domain-containing protein [Pseudarthrobacter sulfonivorans]|uniref:DUF2867 domain-containing protein n=1 Tax=Pseudarthrobacter sulfonivorans TaxID=121292 RepID=UPI00285D1374|nr:DUF2867 domain-containing protein [Pseudarthrobacter sulfonivorans]MDR6417269.1 hypothetical protein [Pseudarthrobacter sulfonivorans]
MDPNPEDKSSSTAGGVDAGNFPVFRSLALQSIPKPDYADVIVLPVPEGTSADPRVWAEELFSLQSMPGWVTALMGLRQAVVGLVGIRKAPAGVFAVSEVRGEEALISADDTHLDFRCGVACDAGARLLRVTTAVRLKGWQGRLYFVPVRLLHPLVVHAMMARTIGRLTALSRRS